jgi:signal peptidase I
MRHDDSVATTIAALKCELAKEVLLSSGSLRFPAIGHSMLPAVWPGDTLVVERVSVDGVRVGDVLVVGRQGRLCAHRVIAKAGDSENPKWITQGDALPVPDCPVSENELLGRVGYVVRKGRLIALASELSAVEKLIAKIVRRSILAARALVYLNRLRRTSEQSVLPCQG